MGVIILDQPATALYSYYGDIALVAAAVKCMFCPWLMHIVNAIRAGFGDPRVACIRGFEQACSFVCFVEL